MPISSWSTTADSNATADSASGIVWSEGQAPSSINNSARAMMAEIKKWYDDPSFATDLQFLTSGKGVSFSNGGQLYDAGATTTVLRLNNNKLQVYDVSGTTLYLTVDAGAMYLNSSTSYSAKFNLGYSSGTYGMALNNASASSGAPMRFMTNGSEVGTVFTTTTSTAYNTSSDARLKDNFAPLTNAGEVIDAINVGTYTWNHVSGGIVGVGVKAQDAYEVVPDAVMKGDDDMTRRPGDEGFQQWAVDYSKFVPYLLAEVKALRARVGQLETK